ncbi:carbamoyltransferase C-terminal domain-containing protein [Streptomyces sp. NPDC013489]|uniref:carbamoyltransferase C-terminal domain-containing protein n=1 Tax=Streptomyces sp. NPDC013489 TaxID=3155606 RepID=UPI0033D93CBA
MGPGRIARRRTSAITARSARLAQPVVPSCARSDAVAPGVVHVDGTTRPQVLEGDEAPTVGSVLDRLSALGYPAVLLNTSFNGRGEPEDGPGRHALREAERVTAATASQVGWLSARFVVLGLLGGLSRRDRSFPVWSGEGLSRRDNPARVRKFANASMAEVDLSR